MNQQTQVHDKSAVALEKEYNERAPFSRLLKICFLLFFCVASGFAAYYVLQTEVSDAHSEDTSEEFADSEESVIIVEAHASESDGVEVPNTSITASINQEIIDSAEHPLDPLLEMAERGLEIVSNNVHDYTAIMTKRVRWKGKLQPEYRLHCKIRHGRCTDDPETSIPFSVYTRFISPKKGQEAIWMEGCHDEKIVAHGPVGFMNLMTVQLEPTGKMAMSGNRYPVQEIGMLNLIRIMIEKGTHDRNFDDCKIVLTRNVMVDDARCSRLEVIHEHPAEHFEFHRAEIYIDDDRNLPIAYRSFSWPDEKGGRPKLLERYYYTDINLNVGLTDTDFDPANESYHFPGQ